MEKKGRVFALVCRGKESADVNLYEVLEEMQDAAVKSTLLQVARDYLATRAEQRGVGFEYDTFSWDSLSTIPENCFEKYGIRTIQNNVSCTVVNGEDSLLD